MMVHSLIGIALVGSERFHPGNGWDSQYADQLLIQAPWRARPCLGLRAQTLDGVNT